MNSLLDIMYKNDFFLFSPNKKLELMVSTVNYICGMINTYLFITFMALTTKQKYTKISELNLR